MWSVTGSHPYLERQTQRGSVTVERIEGGAFVRMHSKKKDGGEWEADLRLHCARA